MSGQLYDEIGEAFEGFKNLPLARYGEVPGFLALVGDVNGKSILDVACGTGFYSREFKRRGAGFVHGVDISGEMINVARKLEEQAPLGITYAVGDTAELETSEPYDIAIAVQAFNYADEIAAVETMFHRIHDSLVDGGEFFLFMQSPDYRFDGPSLSKYGFLCESLGQESDLGPRVKITALLDPPISFEATPPRREVYESCLTAAGFSGIEWVPLNISQAGLDAFDASFWDDLTGNPPLTMLRCRA